MTGEGGKLLNKKQSYIVRLISCGLIGALTLSGCTGSRNIEDTHRIGENEETEGQKEIENNRAGEQEPETETFTEEAVAEQEVAEPETTEFEMAEPETIEEDWSAYFDGMNGAAVIYDTDARLFHIYNRAVAETRRSPCSTFKIISALIALEQGTIDPGDSTRKWSGEVYWNENWNQDIDFNEAFHESCVWYFREVIDEVGMELMQEELDRLSYGNCDISDWEGRLNTNNSNRALTGFWIESSLTISPKEQAEVMERIFGEDSFYSETARNELKEVMMVDTQGEAGVSVYGKTGMGKAEGITVDAWFVGFSESAGKSIYFCVYLGRTDDKNVTSAAAKEIALRLVSDYFDISGM